MLIEHYTKLFIGLNRYPKNDKALDVKLSEISDILCCTNRHANLLLKRMEEQGWLIWTPGLGRGNRSRIKLIQNPESLVLTRCKELVQTGRLKDALYWLKDGIVSNIARDTLFTNLFQKFDPQKENEGGKVFHELRLSFYRPIHSLNPICVEDWFEAQILQQTMEGLVTWDDEKQEFIGQISHHFEVDKSGFVWTFYLRKGVKFHNGQELTSADVVATISTLLTSQKRFWYDCIQKVEMEGTYAVRFTLNYRNELFLNMLGQLSSVIRPKDVLVKETGFEKLPIGSGPFRFIHHDEEKLVLEAFTEYHARRPWLDRVEMLMVPETNGRPATSSDHGFRISFSLNTTEENHPQIVNRKELIEPSVYMILWNFNREGIHHDQYLRKAIHLLLDGQEMVRTLGKGRAFPAHGFLSWMVHTKKPASQIPSSSDTFCLSHNENAECRGVKVQTLPATFWH